jgi:2',5'-phosphodiesterase
LYRYIDASYRRPLIAQEVLGYNADIICLQEVDEKAFSTYFLPVMKHAGGQVFPAHTDVLY